MLSNYPERKITEHLSSSSTFQIRDLNETYDELDDVDMHYIFYGKKECLPRFKKIILNNCRSSGEISVIDSMNLHMLSDCNDISRFYYAFAINSTLSQPINREVEIIPINLPRTDTHSITLPPDDYPDSPRGSFCQDETEYYATRKLYVNIQHHCE